MPGPTPRTSRSVTVTGTGERPSVAAEKTAPPDDPARRATGQFDVNALRPPELKIRRPVRRGEARRRGAAEEPRLAGQPAQRQRAASPCRSSRTLAPVALHPEP